MEDYLNSVDTEEEEIYKSNEVIEIHKNVVFKLTIGFPIQKKF